MGLLPDWRRIVRRAWSIRLIALAGALSGAEVLLPMLEGVVELPRFVLPLLSAATAAAAFVARLVAQRGMKHGD